MRRNELAPALRVTPVVAAEGAIARALARKLRRKARAMAPPPAALETLAGAAPRDVL